jgi:hypothetical protein
MISDLKTFSPLRVNLNWVEKFVQGRQIAPKTTFEKLLGG